MRPASLTDDSIRCILVFSCCCFFVCLFLEVLIKKKERTKNIFPAQLSNKDFHTVPTGKKNRVVLLSHPSHFAGFVSGRRCKSSPLTFARVLSSHFLVTNYSRQPFSALRLLP